MLSTKKLRAMALVLVLVIGIAGCSPVAKPEYSLYDLIEDAVATIEAVEDSKADADTGADGVSHEEELLPTAISGEDADTILESAPESPSELTTAPEQDAVLELLEEASATNALIPIMPIINETHQGFTYRPGQLVAVLAEGFKAGDILAVSLVHENQGQIGTFEVPLVSPRGNTPIYLPMEIDAAGIYPDGEYTFQVSGSDGTQKTYTFWLDFLHPAEPAPFDGCGVYPEPVLDSIVFVWCTGYSSSTVPLAIRGVVDGEELFTDFLDTVYSDGVALYVLDIFADDPAGEWRLEIGQDVLTMNIPGGRNE